MTERTDSPCIRNCCLDDNDICLGCFRSLDEIRVWSQSSIEQRRVILGITEQRKKERDERIKKYKWMPD